MTPDQHPTIRLFYALNALDIVLGNTNNFHRLVDERAEYDEQVLKMRDFSLSVWNADKKRSGDSFEEVLGSVPKELIEPNERSYPYENEAMIDSLKSVLANGEEIVESALNALSTGGGDALDATLNPGASNQTIDLRTKLDEAQSLFGVMKTTLTIPNVSLDSSVEKMDDLASWFRQKSHELGAVIEREKNQSKPVLKKPSTRKPRRTKADKIEDEAKILAFLEEHPDAKRDEISEATGIPNATVSSSPSWQNLKAIKSQAALANKARGLGGVGDPSVQPFSDDEYND
jgi:hypothetical protein